MSAIPEIPGLIDYVRTRVDPKQVYTDIFEDLKWPGGNSEPRVMCCFHEDHNTPSLSLNGETGAFYCHGCSKGGNHVVTFYAAYHELTLLQAAKQMFHKYIRPIISDRVVRSWHRRLRETPSALRYVHKQRFISGDIIERAELGFANNRIIFPLRNEYDLCINSKMYDPLSKKHKAAKMFNHAKEENTERSYAKPMIYPLWAFELAHELGYIVVCEGELDALALLSMGIPAVTNTAGSKAWAPEYNDWFRGLRVIVAYDNDHDGIKYDKVVYKNLHKVAIEIRRLRIPQKFGKDITDWIANGENMDVKQEWLNRFDHARVMIRNDPSAIAAANSETVPLDQASRAEWYNKRIQVDALITGKDNAPYILPKKVRLTCNQECDSCPLAKTKKPYKEILVNPEDPKILQMLDSSEERIRKSLFTMAGMDPCKECEAKAEIIETSNVEQIMLIPTLDSKSSQYVIRTAYYAGHGLKSNRAYRFHGVTVPDPDDQHATHLFDTAKPVQDEIETFQLDPQTKRDLSIFQPGRMRLLSHLTSIAEWQSRNVTKIKERPDMHIAVDLAFHSVQGFDFNGEHVRRGMLDILILGDTRCGKGYVTEGLKRYYGIGEVASAENCTFAGLIGGVQQPTKGRYIITWGIIPLNNNRLVIVDEASGLHRDDFKEMSRVRSEGVAEITKIVREVTQANTRLIWLSNTRNGKPVTERNYGVEAIRELVENNEDISRFDFAMTVAMDEVEKSVINAQSEETSTYDAEKYPASLCRSLVLWAWSRRPEQVRFSREATTEILRQAIEFGNTYSSSIPLVQGENIRIKIAKVSAAIAARVFSCDDTGELLAVDGRHVECACQFLHMLYSKPSMAYDLYSRAVIRANTIDSVKPVATLLEKTGDLKEPVIAGLLKMHHITVDTFSDYVGDPMTAKSMLSDLLKLRCVMRDDNSNFYVKNPAFTTFLRTSQAQESRNGNANGKLDHH